jgi:hypothetical protein
VEQFERIRREHREEEVSIRELARRHAVHRRVVRQALASAVPPPRQSSPQARPTSGRHDATIARWLTEDRAVHRKQRHTARRIWERLVVEEGATVSEPTVRRAVARRRRELGLERVDVAIVAEGSRALRTPSRIGVRARTADGSPLARSHSRRPRAGRSPGPRRYLWADVLLCRT